MRRLWNGVGIMFCAFVTAILEDVLTAGNSPPIHISIHVRTEILAAIFVVWLFGLGMVLASMVGRLRRITGPVAYPVEPGHWCENCVWRLSPDDKVCPICGSSEHISRRT